MIVRIFGILRYTIVVTSLFAKILGGATRTLVATSLSPPLDANHVPMSAMRIDRRECIAAAV
jgi:hypothetical protein